MTRLLRTQVVCKLDLPSNMELGIGAMSSNDPDLACVVGRTVGLTVNLPSKMKL